MSYPTSDTTRALSLRAAALVVVVAVVLMVGYEFQWLSSVSHWVNKQQAAVKVVGQTELLHAKQQYQARLTHDTQHRVPVSTIAVRNDGQLAIVQPGPDAHLSLCSSSCATITSVQGGVVVALPADYVHRRGGHQLTDSPERFTFADTPVVKLTYWDPSRHRAATITASAGVKSIALPAILYSRSVRDLAVGQTGYVAATNITEVSSDRGVVYDFAPVRLEPGMDWFDYRGYSVQITRTKAGLTACAPDGLVIFNPKMEQNATSTSLLPVKITC